MKTHALRLQPGDDLRGSADAFAREHGIDGGFILSGIGSLERAMIRYAGQSDQAYIAGPLEIIALSGTLSPDGVHLHIAVSDANGQLRGGHLCAGSIIRTTAEIVIGESDEFRFARQRDARTGYKELVILRDQGTASD